MRSNPHVQRLGIVLVTVATITLPSHDAAASEASAPASASGAKAERAANRLLEKSVRRTLAKTRGLDTQEGVVVARNGAVTLGGAVPDAAQIALAASAAQAVHGVVSVRNALVIKKEGQ